MRIATALDRHPSQYFKKWIDYHTQLFDKNDFIFLNFSNDVKELEKYLMDKGFDDLTTLTVTETKCHRKHQFDEHLGRLMQHGLQYRVPLIIHCPLLNLIDLSFGVYRQFVHESTYVINKLKYNVLNNNETLIFLDSDELLVGKVHEILKTDFDVLVPAGYTVIQTADEPKLDWSKPIHKQRSFWKREAHFYDKPIIIKKDMEWGPGRHAHHHDELPVTEDVALVHLRDVCFDYLYEENIKTKGIYPETVEDHRVKWEERYTFDKWVSTRQETFTNIINEIKVLLKKYNV
jgi:hypothetical protein